MQTIKGVGASLVAFVTCPCHLPLTVPLLLSLTSGTVVGVWLATHPQTIWLGSLALFIASVVLTVRWFRQENAHCTLPGAHNTPATVLTDYQAVDHLTHLQNQKVEL